MRIAYQGRPGAYSEGAVIEYFGSDCERVPCESFKDALGALADGRADRVALPIENSLAGTIHSNFDLLLKNDNLHIVGELDFRVRHCLMAQKSAAVEDIKRVLSHPMALAQVEQYLKKMRLTPEVAFDTAGSAEIVAKEDLRDAAAVASEHAAEIYGLKVLASGIEDEAENYTRFLMIANRPSPPPGSSTPAKTSVAFTLDNAPGALFKALSIFSVLNIDMTKIESRHIFTLTPELDKQRRWGYVFYVDFAESMGSSRVATAMETFQELTPFYRLLGSYPRHIH